MNRTLGVKENRSGKLNRRQLFVTAGLGAGLLIAGPRLSAPCEKDCEVLKRGDAVDVGEKADEIIERAYKLGYDYEKEHGGCARCTVAALQDAVPFVPVEVALFRGSTCLDGGATPTRTQNCGAFTGAGMVIGHLCGSTRDETFTGDAKLAHELLHKVYHRFKEEYGTVLCEDVRKGAEKDCPKVVGRAAQWVAETLLAQFAGYTPPEPPQKEEKEPEGDDQEPA
jgi:hypothetical protein